MFCPLHVGAFVLRVQLVVPFFFPYGVGIYSSMHSKHPFDFLVALRCFAVSRPTTRHRPLNDGNQALRHDRSPLSPDSVWFQLLLPRILV